MDYRHEYKIPISTMDLHILRQRLRAVARPDPHAVDGKYCIKSLYFDNAADKALWEKLDGVNVREKFRIRYYNGDLSSLHLEKKCKLNGLGSKVMAPLTKEETQMLMNGQTRMLKDSPHGLIRELAAKMEFEGLRAKTIVNYTREPFVFAPGNVRVTFDYDIRTAVGIAGFLEPDCLTIPVPDDPILMEVKWDAFLPDIIRNAVNIPGRNVTAFSKYAQCRLYG